MISLRTCLIALAVVFVAVQTVSSFQCNQCDIGSNCNSTIKKNVTCGNGFDRCVKISYKDKKPYFLACATKNACDDGLYASCSLCEKDGCNTSSFVAPSIFTITIFAAVVTKMYF